MTATLPWRQAVRIRPRRTRQARLVLLFLSVELFDRLNAIPRLPLDEELALIRRAKAGDMRARGRVLAANLRVTCMVAMRYRNLLVGRIDDAIALGTEGLVEALAAFDPERRVRFATYAYHWVRRSITRHLLFRDDVVRRPESVLREGRAGKSGGVDVSLNAPIGNRDGQTGLDLLASDAPSPEDLTVDLDDRRERERTLVAIGFHQLDERTRFVLRELVMSEEPRTAREVADELGLCRQRVQQLRDRALLALRSAARHGSRSSAARGGNRCPRRPSVLSRSMPQMSMTASTVP